MIPIYGFVQGDTMGLLILANEKGTATDLAANMLAAVALRAGADEAMQIVYNGKMIDPMMTLERAGIKPLDRVELRIPEANASKSVTTR